MTPEEWVAAYGAAWEAKDADAVVRLFTPDADYREAPYDEAFHGHAGIRDYWTRVTATQEDVRFRFGKVISDGDRAAVEWWTTMRNGGADVTLAGEFFLAFDENGLVTELREYWHYAPSIVEPPAGWGE